METGPGLGSASPLVAITSLLIQSINSLRSSSVGVLAARLGGISRLVNSSATRVQKSLSAARWRASDSLLNCKLTPPRGFSPLWQSPQYWENILATLEYR